MSDNYKHIGGYKRQLELAGITWSRNDLEVIRQVQAVNTYAAWRALRAMFKSYSWSKGFYPRQIDYYLRCAARAAFRADERNVRAIVPWII
jgi:hypothetical protein